MRLLIIRHGIAMAQEEFASSGQPDDMRPLTTRGMKKMKRAARGLRTEVESLDHVATSPLTRAVQTAEIVTDVFGVDEAEVTASLVPGVAFEDFETWIAAHANQEVIAVIGHEPHLSSLATWLLTGSGDSRLNLGKGGACLIEFRAEPRRNAGMLLWLLTPRQLRAL
jgi:phosphohistidine phosphatase